MPELIKKMGARDRKSSLAVWQRKHSECVGGDDGDILFAVPAEVGDGVGVAPSFQGERPQFLATSRVERPEAIVVR